MKQTALNFPSITAICLFLKDSKLQNFLLLGKKKTLIAQLTREALNEATIRYGAVSVDTYELETQYIKETVPHSFV